MKRVLALLLCLVAVVLPLASCGGSVNMTDEDTESFFTPILPAIYMRSPRAST